MLKGTVKFLHDEHGYGFIETDEMEDDVYFDLDEQDSDLQIEEGDEVEFEQGEGDKGPKANDITVL
ncbi:cold-shock protein [Candidatus Nanohaloarchaea archaeon]|nr:cold-shock protein [Candidatus Nanohaloarchaea archaeon]